MGKVMWDEFFDLFIATVFVLAAMSNEIKAALYKWAPESAIALGAVCERWNSYPCLAKSSLSPYDLSG